MNQQDHIVKSFDSELARLYGEIQQMGELAMSQLNAAVDVLNRRDSNAAARVVAGYRIAAGVQLLVAPASLQDMKAAEAEGIVRLLTEAVMQGVLQAAVVKRGRLFDRRDLSGHSTEFTQRQLV